MSRFAITTLITITAACVAWGLCTGIERALIVGAIWTLYTITFAAGVTFIQMQFFCPAVCRRAPGHSRIALTFDDGPDPRVTPALLDLLARKKVPAAFFCIGKYVTAHPALAARIAAEGHLLANHTYNHKWSTVLMRRTGLTSEIAQTQSAIQQATGITPAHFRPPIGLTNPHYASVLKQMNLTMVGWSVRSLESVFSTANVLRRIRRARDGGIILLHDRGDSPDRLLEIVLTAIHEAQARGLTFERLDRLIDNSLAPVVRGEGGGEGQHSK
jgi:peptidoglycan-N-acetylglucosamine deacetylase